LSIRRGRLEISVDIISLCVVRRACWIYSFI